MPSRGARIAAALLLLAPTALAGDAETGPESGRPAGSALRFVGKNLVTRARGEFHAWRFTRIEIDRERPEASVVEIEIDVASLDTGIEGRDEHLRSEDFFEVERFPTARVRVTDARPDGESPEGHRRYRARFEVTVRDVTRTLDAQFDVLSLEPARVRGELELDRVDFGVGSPPSRWNPLAVSRRVPVSFEAELPLGS